MIGVIWRNRAIVPAICFVGLVVSAAAQPSDNSATNQAPGQPVNNAATNQPPEEGFATNTAELLQPAVTNTYGAQPFANEFEAQNNAAPVAGPSVIGSGLIGSPVMGTGVFGLPGFAPATGPGLYQSGNLNVHAHLSYSFIYGTGLDAQPGDHTAVIEQVVSPGVTIDIGNHWTLDYSASPTFYSGNSNFTDTTGQFAALHGSTSYNDWAFGMSQSYSYTATPLVETGVQTKEESYVTALNVSRQLGGNYSMTLGLNQTFLFAEPFDDVHTWSGNIGLNYEFSPKLQVGLNVGGGYDEVSISPTMTYESYQGVLMFKSGSKTTISLSGGIQDESFDAEGVPSSIAPIFSASVAYQLFKGTSISLNAGRSISPSFFSNEVYTVSSVGVGLQQQLTPKLTLSVTGSYGTSSYEEVLPGMLPKYYLGTPTVSALQVTREDDITYIGASLSYAFRPRLIGSVSYSYSDNSSSQGNYGYTSSQVAVQLSYQY